MRVLKISNWFPPRYVGGAEVSAFSTARGLQSAGVDVRVFSACRKHREAFDNRLEFGGLKIREVGLPPTGSSWREMFDPEVFRLTLAELRDQKPDLVHIHNISGASLAPVLACRVSGVPVIFTLHDHWLLCTANVLYRRDGSLCRSRSSWSCCGDCYQRYDRWAEVPFRRRWFRLLTSGVSRFITPSRRLMELHLRCGYDSDRFRVIRYGIESGASAAMGPGTENGRLQSRIRKLLGSGSRRILLFSGALVETKGVDTLVEAIPLISKYLGDIQLWVAGAGEGRYTELMRRVQGAEVAVFGRLSFDAVREVYGNAGLTVVPSVWFDNSPVVIYESLLAGTPIVGSRIGGIPELIRERQTGYLFEPRDAVDLASRVVEHFSRPASECRGMRRACTAFASAELSLDNHLEALMSEYGKILGSN